MVIYVRFIIFFEKYFVCKVISARKRRHRRYYQTMPCTRVSKGIFHYFHGRCGIYYRFSGLGSEWLMLIGFYSRSRQWHKFLPTDASQQPESAVLQLALHQTVVMGYFDFHFYCTIKKSFFPFTFWVSKVHDHLVHVSIQGWKKKSLCFKCFFSLL